MSDDETEDLFLEDVDEDIDEDDVFDIPDDILDDPEALLNWLEDQDES